jgi:outer membrane protein assembly factor BamB/tRNA A-37 threonylcarbamoyl transferase component Bud32
MTQSFSAGQSPDKQLQSGTLLSERYLIQEVIGIGGMGSVYRARDMHFQNVMKLVAVKEMINLAPDPIIRQTIVQNFEREANILVSLSHPSIPKIFDYFTKEDRSYLVIEYVQGRDLDAILNQTQGFFNEDQVIAWGIELCDVIQYLHTHKPEPIIFRDMKPSNIMVNQYNHIVLVDFGIAKVFKTGQKGTMIGTEGYSPPEQYRGEATPIADIYALGATIHHLLTRRDPRLEPPFTFNDRQVRQINPAVSVELEMVVTTALQYSPTDRFQSAEAMKEALIAAARKTGALSRITYASAPQLADQGVKPLWVFECEDEIRGTPTVEGGVVYIGAYDNNMYAINAVKGEFVWKFSTQGGVVSRPLFQDGIVCFGSEDRNFYAVLARTGKISWTYMSEGPIRSSPKLLEGHVFFGSDDNYLYAVNINTSRLAWRFDLGSPVRSTPLIANDMIYIGTEGGDLVCLSFQGQLKWRFSAKRAISASPAFSKGLIFFPSLDSTCYALDAKSGWAIWRFRMGKGSVSSPCVTENYVFVGSADGFLYCLDSGSAKEIWRFKTDHQVSGSPVIYKDSIYCGSADGNLYCLEYRTGRLRWKYATDKPITGTPVVMNDIVYVGSTDKKLYALYA